MEYETVIGLEVHLQLSTNSKIFCGASAEFGGDPNQYIDPLTFGLPGALPVLNKKVVEYAMMMGLALNCQIRRLNRFARKHYFYPDLPKGYQISQYEEPICEQGYVEVRSGDSVRTVGITRIHMEEDAGKNIHDSRTNCSLVDLNRAGVPLLEIVSQPDIRSASEASDYLRTLRQIARYLGISDGNMEEGSLRCDANVSLRPKGELKFGTRTEVKNVNSFKFVERAIEYEVARQHAILKSGEEVVQETRLFDSGTGTTRSMRSKEESSDYRYFPDPDLPPLVVEQSWVESVRSKMPTLPADCRRILVEEYELSDYDAGVLTAERSFMDYYEEVRKVSGNAKLSCNWVTSELFGALKKAGQEIEESPVSAANLGKLVLMLSKGDVNGKMAKDIFEEMFNTGAPPDEIVKEKGLQQITDDSVIRNYVVEVLEEQSDQLAQYLGGNEKLFGFFVGQVMKKTSGSANPRLVNEIISEELGKKKSEE